MSWEVATRYYRVNDGSYMTTSERNCSTSLDDARDMFDNISWFCQILIAMPHDIVGRVLP